MQNLESVKSSTVRADFISLSVAKAKIILISRSYEIMLIKKYDFPVTLLKGDH